MAGQRFFPVFFRGYLGFVGYLCSFCISSPIPLVAFREVRDYIIGIGVIGEDVEGFFDFGPFLLAVHLFEPFWGFVPGFFIAALFVNEFCTFEGVAIPRTICRQNFFLQGFQVVVELAN